MTMYEKYCKLNIDSRWIGLEESDSCVDYFCTPLDATVIGCKNSIHYCFIKGYRDMVNDYYDTLGLERPDGSENEMQKFEFGAVTFSFLKKER